MRNLSEKEIASINRFTKQHSQLRHAEQKERAYCSSNALIDRIINEIEGDDPKILARLTTFKVANYNGLGYLIPLRSFINKLIAVSTERVKNIKEIEL